MKTLPVALLSLSLVTAFTACTKEKQEISQLSILPAATRTGANTFGALVNGIAYIPNGTSLNTLFSSSPLQAAFDPQSLSVHAGRKVNTGTYYKDYDLGFSADSIPLTQGTTYVLGSAKTNRFSADYLLFDNSNPADNSYTTDDTHTGTLRIDSIDYTKNFISGTFSFDAVNAKGVVVHVTNGRFDVKVR